ncbi:MAG: hypothetical protein U0174_20475 [Polyangiaceae bacterium]
MPDKPRVFRLLTCRNISEPDVDAEPLLAAMQARGCDTSWVAWEDVAEPEPDATYVLRSTWNYFEFLDAFLEKMKLIADKAKLVNALPIVAWNVDKAYLGELANEGFVVTETKYVARGATGTLSSLMNEHGFVDVVVKPRVSAGSFGTQRFRLSEGIDEKMFRSMSEERDLMVQPYLSSVDGYGERAIVLFDGKVSHACRKSPRFAGGVEVTVPVPVAPEERVFAEKLVAWVSRRFGTTPAFARVDVARNAKDEPCLMELELSEPSLYLESAEGIMRRFVDTLLAT